MKRYLAITLVTEIPVLALLETATAQTAPPSAQKSLAASMDVYVFPTKGQASSQQSEDEASCYSWAVQNTGNDPFDLQKESEKQKQDAATAQEQAKKAGEGAGAKGAVGGAAAGALIGAIAGDAGKGAAYGAAAGLIAGRRARRRAEQSATQSATQQAQQAQTSNAEAVTNFKKAFSVCLEAKNYLVKY